MENYENPQVDEVLDVDAEEPVLGESLEIANKCDKAGPLQGLIDFMQECLEKEDSKGFAEVYKTAGDYILQSVAKMMEDDKLTFTPTDISRGDGYFIFSMGTNSVLHFHVKECPGWLFGIWFSPVEDEDSTDENPKYVKDRICVQFFTQYEETIDKFKPTASTIVETESQFHINDDAPNWWFFNRLSCVFKMIIKYPAIMWYRDMHYADLNHEYVTVEEANEEFTEWRLKENNKKLIYAENERVMLDALKHIAGPVIESGDAFIADSGANCSPRYELIILNTGDPKDDGLYHIWDLGYEDADADKEYFKTKEKECEERAKDFWWSNPVSSCCNYISKERFEKAKYYHEHPEEDDD